MNAELKKQLLIGLFAIIVALIGAAGAIIPTMRNQEFSVLKEENSRLEETISELTEENSQLRERISVLENGTERPPAKSRWVRKQLKVVLRLKPAFYD